MNATGDCSPVPITDPGGVVVAVCTGYRCAALRRSLGSTHSATHQPGHDGDGLTDLREAVQATPGAVLMLMPCMDTCSHGPVVAVGRRVPRQGARMQLACPATLFGPVGDGSVRQLSAWVRSGSGGAPPIPPVLADHDISPVMHRVDPGRPPTTATE